MIYFCLEYLMKVGNGKNFVDNEEHIRLPKDNIVQNLDDLINFCYRNEALNDPL